MSRIAELFTRKKERVLNVYCTAGYPSAESTISIMEQLEKYGADLIELGMPYSDPLADGPVIQESSMIALRNGMSITKLFEQLSEMRPSIRVPVILMGYMNPVLQFGFEKFCAEASRVGVDGLILPDLPEHEFTTMYADVINKYGLDFIFLVTPETSEERIRKLDNLSSGFLYAVSSSSTTGSDKNNTGVESYLERISKMKLKNPVLVGFGIKDKNSFEMACRYTNGAIIGSAFIKAVADKNSIENDTSRFLQSILS